MEPSQSKVAAWYLRPAAVGIALVFLYPLGLVLLNKRPGPRGLARWVAAIGCFPLFGLVVLLALKPFWVIGGAAGSPGDFSLDFDSLFHNDRLEEDRRRQKSLQSIPSRAAAIDSVPDWTSFRGPNRDGVCIDTDISLDWNRNPPREIYRQPIGGGYASFVVAEGRAYTLEQRRGNEAVTCYDFASGRELWAVEYEASFEETLGGDGPRATPTIFVGRLYALGAQGHLHCLDAATGRILWAHNILQDFGASNLRWGLSGSPLIEGNMVIVTGSGDPPPSVFAYDAADGRLIWKSDAGMQAYSSLVATTLAGRRQILNLGADSLRGFDPTTGEVLWSYPWPTGMGINCSQPIPAGDDRIFISSGYSQGGALLRVEHLAGKFVVTELWQNTRMKNKFTSSVIRDGFIYGLDEAILCCLDLTTGELKWKGGRYQYGSLLLCGDHLIVLGEQGQLVLVKADPDGHQELGLVPLFSGKTWNNFVLTGGRLLARNHKEMVCLDLRPN